LHRRQWQRHGEWERWKYRSDVFHAHNFHRSSVTGLDGTGLVLQNNGGNNLTISANGSFTFSNLIVSGGSYNVTVLTQPSTPAQTCTVSTGSGTTTSNVITVQVLCPAVFFPVGGQVVGLVGTGGGMVLQNNGGDNLPLSGNGAFTFVTQIAYGGQYDVNLFVGPTTQPQGCVTWGYQGLVTGPVNTILVDCGHNDWLWLNGSNTANANGSTTTPPTNPITALDTSAPGGRKYAATWVDNGGNLWLFGGIGYDIPTTTTPIFLNDMWEYIGTQSYYGGYPTYWNQVVANLSGAGPTPRWGAISWTDSAGTLWLFGGQEAGTGFRNDLWSFNTGSKTWTVSSIGGYNANGTYGTKGVPAGGNVPGGRWGATAQLDSFGNLWLFGGFGYDASSTTPGSSQRSMGIHGWKVGVDKRLQRYQPGRRLRDAGHSLCFQRSRRSPGFRVLDRFFRQFLRLRRLQPLAEWAARRIQRPLEI
jgi:hypothetical protein